MDDRMANNERGPGIVAVSLAVVVAGVLSNAASAQRPDVAGWAATGRDLYGKCASAEATVAHACGEFLLGVLDGVVIATPKDAQVFCPPDHLSFFQLEAAYVNWAKANPDLLGRERAVAAAGALSAAFPCHK
jgi:hypothetical protein